MNAQPAPIDYDEVYQALTRPPMVGGITEVYAIFLLTFEVTVFVGVGGGRGMVAAALLFPFVYAFGYLMCMRDARIFEIWAARLRWFSAARRRQAYWRGESFDAY